MSKTYRPYDPDQQLLLPAAMREWLPDDHLAYFISDVVDELELLEITARYERESRGGPPYHPRMMVKVLLYGYCVGVASSRRIAQRLRDRRGARGKAPQMTTTRYERHPFSARFGAMDPYTFAQLRESMATTDYETSERQPDVVLYEDMVLDGWHRYTICMELAIEPAYTVFTGDRTEAWAFVMQENRFRRHLTQAQIASMYILAHSDDDRDLTVRQLADEARVSKRTYEQVRAGIDAGYADELTSSALTAAQAYSLARQRETPTAKRRSKADRLQAELERAQSTIEAKNQELASLHNRVLVLNARLGSDGDVLPPNDAEIDALRTETARLTKVNDTLANANGRMRAHLLAISDLVALSDPITEQDLASLARQYRPQNVQLDLTERS